MGGELEVMRLLGRDAVRLTEVSGSWCVRPGALKW